jgi:hypothetical protein
MRTYAILNKSDYTTIINSSSNMAQVKQDNENTLKSTLNDSECIVSYTSLPTWMTSGSYTEYTHESILSHITSDTYCTSWGYDG